MEAVGYDLYIKILEEAVSEGKGMALPQHEDCLIDITVDAFIPPEYIPSTQQRIDVYRKIAHLASAEELDDLTDELADRFGDIPRSVENLAGDRPAARLRGKCGFHVGGTEGPADIILHRKGGYDEHRGAACVRAEHERAYNRLRRQARALFIQALQGRERTGRSP